MKVSAMPLPSGLTHMAIEREIEQTNDQENCRKATKKCLIKAKHDRYSLRFTGHWFVSKFQTFQDISTTLSKFPTLQDIWKWHLKIPDNSGLSEPCNNNKTTLRDWTKQHWETWNSVIKCWMEKLERLKTDLYTDSETEIYSETCE
jgi:hypothetical protein